MVQAQRTRELRVGAEVSRRLLHCAARLWTGLWVAEVKGLVARQRLDCCCGAQVISLWSEHTAEALALIQEAGAIDHLEQLSVCS